MLRDPVTSRPANRLSARASLTVWLVVAGLFWLGLGLAFGLVGHATGGLALSATPRRLSGAAPAGNPPSATP